jgi:deoxyribodipyrimidine photo-lyase
VTETSPILIWFRRDLRLSDHAAMTAAAATGRPIIPVFIRDALVDGLGAAPKFRLGQGLACFDRELRNHGSAMVFRSGEALQVLETLLAETGAGAIWWSRAYDPDSVARDRKVKEAFKARGADARSFAGHLMFEPWTVETGQGGFYKVYTPFWKAVRGRDVASPLPAPARLASPAVWPVSETLSTWHLDAAMRHGAEIVAPHLRLGERAAHDRLTEFMDSMVAAYDANRDLPAVDGTSGLSENLALGEISPALCWHAGLRAMSEGKPGAETFLKELVWREFAYHLMWHTPHILTANWKEPWDAFPWNTDDSHPHVQAWLRGRTGIRFVDAGLREMYVTGRMHNRARMIVASYLTKHLLTHWKIGQRWFEDCLIDWDPASNAMGWQWSSGSGPDATPYFRIFNPVSQRDKFDPQRRYVDRWIAEGRRDPHADALKYFDAVPLGWGLSPGDAYPEPVVAADLGRRRALEAWENKPF